MKNKFCIKKVKIAKVNRSKVKILTFKSIIITFISLKKDMNFYEVENIKKSFHTLLNFIDFDIIY